jgi:hypothetical protein
MPIPTRDEWGCSSTYEVELSPGRDGRPRRATVTHVELELEPLSAAERRLLAEGYLDALGGAWEAAERAALAETSAK